MHKLSIRMITISSYLKALHMKSNFMIRYFFGSTFVIYMYTLADQMRSSKQWWQRFQIQIQSTKNKDKEHRFVCANRMIRVKEDAM